MLLTCEQALRVRNVLDDWLPARIRDSKVVMYPLLRLVFGRRFRVFADFKQQGFWLSADQFSDVYRSTAGLQKVQGGTDLNEECVRAITDAVVGATVLYAGCGRGHLVDVLSSRGGPVVGSDIVLDQALTTGTACDLSREASRICRFWTMRSTPWSARTRWNMSSGSGSRCPSCAGWQRSGELS